MFISCLSALKGILWPVMSSAPNIHTSPKANKLSNFFLERALSSSRLSLGDARGGGGGNRRTVCRFASLLRTDFLSIFITRPHFLSLLACRFLVSRCFATLIDFHRRLTNVSGSPKRIVFLLFKSELFSIARGKDHCTGRVDTRL